MARVQNPLIGRASGKFGTGVFATLFGQNILRSLPVEVRNPKTPAQVIQREKFAAAVAFIKSIYSFILFAFPINLTRMTPAAFVLPSVLKHAGAEAGITESATLAALDTFNPTPGNDAFYISIVSNNEVTVDLNPSLMALELIEGDNLKLAVINVDKSAVNVVDVISAGSHIQHFPVTLAGTDPEDYIVVFLAGPTRNRFKAGTQLMKAICSESTLRIDTWVIPITGQDTETQTDGTIVFSATEDVDVIASGDVTLVSTTKADDDIYRRHDVMFNIPRNGSGSIIVKDTVKVVSLGNHGGASNPVVNFYTGDNTSAPILTWNLNQIPINLQKIRQNAGYNTILPTTGTKAFPPGITYLSLNGANIAWEYTGSLPAGLTHLSLLGNYNLWTYTGALPPGLKYVYLLGNSINWTYSEALPTGLTFLIFSGSNLNWTGLDIGNTGTMTNFGLSIYRMAKMSSEDMVTLLTQMTNSAKVFPATVTINEYADHASPPQSVTDAVTALKAAKSTIVNVYLGA